MSLKIACLESSIASKDQKIDELERTLKDIQQKHAEALKVTEESLEIVKAVTRELKETTCAHEVWRAAIDNN